MNHRAARGKADVLILNCEIFTLRNSVISVVRGVLS